VVLDHRPLLVELFLRRRAHADVDGRTRGRRDTDTRDVNPTSHFAEPSELLACTLPCASSRSSAATSAGWAGWSNVAWAPAVMGGGRGDWPSTTCSAVLPLPSLRFMFAPPSTSARTTARLPSNAAQCSAESPAGVTASGFAPAWSSSFTASTG